MAYFAAIKITDADGNIVELYDVTPLLENILAELKAIRTILGQMGDTTIEGEDFNDSD